MNHKTCGTYISINAKHVLSPSCSVCGCSRKKKTQQVIILAKWFSEGEDAENNRNAHLVLRNEAFMACQRWPEAQCVAQAVLILPFSNGSALREAIIWLRTMVCQMQRKECVFFFFFLVLYATGVVFPSFLALQLVSEKFRSKAT